MLFDFSEEGDVSALGVFPGRVVRFPANQYGEDGSRLKVPQMGWNRVRKTMDHYMWEGSRTILGSILSIVTTLYPPI